MAGGFLGAIFGTKPTVPPWKPITAGATQLQAIANNAAALPSDETLASGVNAFNQSQLTAMLNNIIPNFSAQSGQASQNISSELQGKLPADVTAQLQESDAAQALTGGFGGSGLAGNLTARDLGLTSLNLMQTGQSELENWTNLMDKIFQPGEFNVSSMFIDPQTEFQDTMANQEMQFSRDWLSNQVAAMPDPRAAGLEKVLSGLGTGLISGLGAAI